MKHILKRGVKLFYKCHVMDGFNYYQFIDMETNIKYNSISNNLKQYKKLINSNYFKNSHVVNVDNIQPFNFECDSIIFTKKRALSEFYKYRSIIEGEGAK